MSHIHPPRSDVVRHRIALLEAATRLFAHQGVHVPLESVAAESGVGRATLYRHFPDRTALLLALIDREIEQVMTVFEQHPRGDVLIAMVRRFAAATKEASVLADAWRALSPDDSEMLRRQQDLISAFEQPLADAIQAGTVRSDLTLDDVVSVVRMVAGAARQAANTDASDRIVDLVLNGLRARH